MKRKRLKPCVVVKRYNDETSSTSWTVWLINRVQSFRFAYTGTRAECLWYKKMLKKAGVG